MNGIAAAEAGRRGAEHRGGRIEVVAGHQFGAHPPLDVKQRTQRHHRALRVPDIQILDVVDPQPVRRVRLDIDLKGLIELGEQIHIGRAQKSLKRAEDVIHGHREGLRLDPIDVQEELRALGAEGSAQEGEPGLGGPDPLHLQHGALQFRQAETAAILDHQLQAARLTQPGDGRRRHRGDTGLLNGIQTPLEFGEYRLLVQPHATLVPGLVNGEQAEGIAEIRGIQHRKSADRDPGGDAWRLLQHCLDLPDRRTDARLGGTLRQLAHHDGVTLVLDRQKPGLMMGVQPAAADDNREEHQTHGHRPLHHPAHQRRVGRLETAIQPIEGAVEDVGTVIHRARLEIHRALRRFKRQRVDGADDGGRGDDQRELAKQLAGNARQKGRRQEHGG